MFLWYLNRGRSVTVGAVSPVLLVSVVAMRFYAHRQNEATTRSLKLKHQNRRTTHQVPEKYNKSQEPKQQPQEVKKPTEPTKASLRVVFVCFGVVIFSACFVVFWVGCGAFGSARRGCFHTTILTAYI